MRISLLVCSLFFAAATVTSADLYQWTDDSGVVHVVDESSEVPRAYREKVKVFESQKTRTPPPSTLPLIPSRTYPLYSQGRFAQKLALDLGLIKNRAEDAISPLIGVGIRPASGWQTSEPLTADVVDEVTDAARRAADARRVSLSADGATAITHQAATAILPPPAPAQEQVREETPPPQQVIIHQTPPTQIIEVERETVPVYVPVPVVPHYSHPHPRRRYPRHDRHPGDGPFTPAPPTGPHTDRWHVPQTQTPHSPRGPHTSTPGPTHMPFGASHMPFGTGSHSTQRPFGR
jgi:hypothetical protein